MYEFLSLMYPKGIRKLLFAQFDFFSLNVRREFIIGTIFFFSFMISLSFALQFSTALFPSFLPFISLLIVFALAFAFIQFMVYSLISIVATNRGRFIETVLPDALQLISANLRAGMTIDRALIASSRAEFGNFNDQFAIVGKEISTGTRVSEALLNMTKRVKSMKFAKAMQLIVTGMNSGGELSRLLSEVAEHLVHQRTVEQKVKTSVTTYLIFIGTAVGFAAPILYGLSTAIVRVIVGTFSSVDIPANSNMPFSIEMSDDTAAFLSAFVRTYTNVSLVTLSIMSSFLLGLIKKGSARHGMIYIPFLVTSGLIIYNVVAWAANSLFDSIV